MTLKQLIITPIPVGTLLLSILMAGLADRYFPIIHLMPLSLSFIGWIVIGFGLLILIFTLIWFLMSRTTALPGGEPRQLLTNGPFAYSRNPIYLGDLIVALGAAVIYGSMTALIAPVICLVVLNIGVIPYEESVLEKVFGRKYSNYKASVRRWI